MDPFFCEFVYEEKKNLEIWKIGYRIDQFEEKKKVLKRIMYYLVKMLKVLIETTTTLDLLGVIERLYTYLVKTGKSRGCVK